MRRPPTTYIWTNKSPILAKALLRFSDCLKCSVVLYIFNLKMKHLKLLLLFCICIPAVAQKSLQLEDLNNIVSLSNPSISPDGKSAVFIKTVKNYQENRFESELRWISIPEGEQKVLSSKRGIGAVQWIKDGQAISFLASSNNGRQVFILPMDGGESKAITQHPTGIRRYSWNPGEDKIAFFAYDPRSKKSKQESYNDAFEVGSDDFLQTRAPSPTSVWVFDIKNKESKKISPEKFTVATELSMSGLNWSTDGTQLYVTRFPSAHSGDSDLGNNYILHLDGSSPEKMLKEEGYQGNPFPSPDGKSIYYSYRRDGVPANVMDIYQKNKETGEINNVTLDLDRNFFGAFFTPKDQLIAVAPDKDKISLWLQSTSGNFNKLSFGELTSIGSLTFSKDGALLFEGQSATHPDELYYKANINAKPIVLTQFNKEISEKKQGKRVSVEWESTKGYTPNGILTYPVNFDPNKKYPLVLYIHGGPTASSLLTFSAVPQIMAGQDWFVFQPNYRGSNNLGNDFQSAIANDAAQGPGEDVMKGVEALIEKGFIDTDKIVISGWSYGGWMTSWMIGRYPEVWKAAVAGAAPVDFTDMYSLSDLNRMRRHSITASPYTGDNLMKAYEQSPIIHFSKLKTPTLIMSKTGDYRVSITGSYKLYGALRDNNVPVEFIAYPGPGHFPSDPVRSLDVYTRWIGWFQKYIGKKRP